MYEAIIICSGTYILGSQRVMHLQLCIYGTVVTFAHKPINISVHKHAFI